MKMKMKIKDGSHRYDINRGTVIPKIFETKY